jgi:hypothetical protein
MNRGHEPEEQQVVIEISDGEEPMDREVLDSPEMKARARVALARARRGRHDDGKTADDLLRLAREQRRGVATRT